MKTKLALDIQTLSLLRKLSATGIEYIVVGAKAREILLRHVHGLSPGRSTQDLDLAIFVKDWQNYHAIRSILLGAGFRETRDIHKLVYWVELPGADTSQYKLDILPYGGVENPDGYVIWPLEYALMMNMAGYQQASDFALSVEIESGLIVRIVNLPSFVTLKLLCWNDRHGTTTRDAEDILLVMRHYGSTQEPSRPYDDACFPAFEQLGFDLDNMWLWLLGSDIRAQANEHTLTQLQALLNDEQRVAMLVRNMDPIHFHPEQIRAMLEVLRQGMSWAK